MRALVYHLPLGEMDGTSVVLRRVYGPEAATVRQISFRRGRFPIPPEFSVEEIRGNLEWPWQKGARFAQKNGGNWWYRHCCDVRAGCRR